MKRFPVVPSRRLIALLAFCAGLALLAPLLRLSDDPTWLQGSETLGQLSWLAFLILFLLASWDLLHIKRCPDIELEREVVHSLAVNNWTEVSLRIRHPFKQALRIEVFDFYPAGAEVKFMPQGLMLHAAQQCELRYRLRPLQRGQAEFGTTQCLIPSPLGLWILSRMSGAPTQVRVYPDFNAVSHYQLLATDHHTSQLGIKHKPRRGEGLEFHQLRDYRQGDSLRQIDWKATVRRQKLIAKEYQDERDQQIFFMLDSGRHMRAQDDQLSHFDHALNALLLLSHIALRQGDAVGLMSFGGQPRWLAPRKGSAAVNGILNSVYDIQPTTQASDYLGAAQALLRKQRKRALVVIMTNLREENYEALLPALQLLRRHHLVLLANLREQVLDKTLLHPVRDFDEALTYLGTISYVQARQGLQEQLRQRGVLNIDSVPSELAVRVVNSYLEIKRSRIL